MHSHKIYIVASTENVRDVHIQNVYDGDVFTLDSIVAGLKDQLKGLRHYISSDGSKAYIDIIDSQNELVKTISIVSKNVMLKY